MENVTTSLDELYKFLQENKILRIEDITSTFNINEELALNWAKILESGKLAEIINPKIGKPLVKIPGYNHQEIFNETNNLIKNNNQHKINQARRLISESKKRGHDEDFIKKMFIEKGWPLQLIDDLFK